MIPRRVISLSSIKSRNSDNNYYHYTAISKRLKLWDNSISYGDANGDHVIDNKDIIMIKKFIANLDTSDNSTVPIGQSRNK